MTIGDQIKILSWNIGDNVKCSFLERNLGALLNTHRPHVVLLFEFDRKNTSNLCKGPKEFISDQSDVYEKLPRELSNYSMFRSRVYSTKKSCREVAIFISNELGRHTKEDLQPPIDNYPEIEGVVIFNLKNTNRKIGAVHFPKKSGSEIDQSLNWLLEQESSNNRCILIGDFNISEDKLRTSSYTSDNYSKLNSVGIGVIKAPRIPYYTSNSNGNKSRIDYGIAKNATEVELKWPSLKTDDHRPILMHWCN